MSCEPITHNRTMVGSLKRLLSGAVEDARWIGSPTAVSAEELLAHLALRAGRHTELFGPVRASATSLEAIRQIFEEQSDVDILELSVLGSNGEFGDWDSDRVEDAERLTRFQEQSREDAELVSYEVPIPPGLSPDRLDDLRGFSSLELYLAVPTGVEGEEWLASIAEADWLGAAMHLDRVVDSDARAQMVQAFVTLQIPFRVRGGRDGEGALVLAAAALAMANDLSRREIRHIFEAPADLRWSDEGLNWRDQAANQHAIEEVRDLFAGFDIVKCERWLSTVEAWQGHGLPWA